MPLILIPSRFNSSRFTGKPLAKICGKEMILHVAERCVQAVGHENVYVVTDDKRIESCVTGSGYRAILNSKDAICGTDRIANVASVFDHDLVVNVQGDEPLVDPEDIKKVIAAKRRHIGSVINCYCYEKGDINNPNTPKVVTDGALSDNLVYMSRQPIPTGCAIYKRQIGIYAFWMYQLVEYYGEKFSRGFLETHENIEILRFLEHRVKVKMIKLPGAYQSVDVPADIKKVEKIIERGKK